MGTEFGMLSNVLMWNKIGRVVTRISEQRGISASQALDLFYTSPLCSELHDPATGLYLMGDEYLAQSLTPQTPTDGKIKKKNIVTL